MNWLFMANRVKCKIMDMLVEINITSSSYQRLFHSHHPSFDYQCDVSTSLHLQGTDTRGSLRAGDDCVNIKTYSFNASIMSLTVHNVTAVDVR